ncbi:MAG TPA: DUF2239 family protein [Ideonella sp.]|uniref:DUF2239 family protein n=1 Tax=Ideonella sp. TaxID=1929293 RepID=UPI002E352F1D|nr:DUF2239 family protein [Ideonella sp.]HEX5686169.1 DUF2239 family protein [Ideonella sp.]
MTPDTFPSYTGFDGFRRIAQGPLQVVALRAKRALDSGAAGPVLVFDDQTGRCVDIDTRGSDDEVVTRLAALLGLTAAQAVLDEAEEPASEPRGRGRPKLGVVAREVTLLPRHWAWLASQPGGASVALRKLVDEARRVHGDKDRQRKAQERAYHFMSAIAGDLPGYEEATRALFANDRKRFVELVAAWPADLADHATTLAFSDEL